MFDGEDPAPAVAPPARPEAGAASETERRQLAEIRRLVADRRGLRDDEADETTRPLPVPRPRS